MKSDKTAASEPEVAHLVREFDEAIAAAASAGTAAERVMPGRRESLRRELRRRAQRSVWECRLRWDVPAAVAAITEPVATVDVRLMTSRASVARQPMLRDLGPAVTVGHVVRDFTLVDQTRVLAIAHSSSPTVVITHDAVAVAAARRLWLAGSRHTSDLTSARAGGEDRRARVLAGLLEGLPDNAIARRLDVSERTVRGDVRALMDVSGARTRFQLGVYVAGLAPPP